MNFIRTKNLGGTKVSDFLSSQQMMQNTAYNYKIDHLPTDLHTYHQIKGKNDAASSKYGDTNKKTIVHILTYI